MAASSATVKGGDKAGKALAALGKKIATGKYVKVGFLEGATYPAAVHRPKQGGLSVAQVAFWNEFGTVTSPPRPFFRQMIAAGIPEWPKMFAAALKASGYDTRQALTLMGIEMSAQLQESIRSGNFAALSPITLMLRKMADDDPGLVISGKTVGEAAQRVARGESGAAGDRAQPLLDQQIMVEAVNYEVKA